MAIVNWETSYASDSRSENLFAVEVNDQTEAIRRVHWNIQPGYSVRVVVPDHSIDETIAATTQSGEQIGDQNIAGNVRLILNEDDPQNTYLEAPFEWAVYWQTFN